MLRTLILLLSLALASLVHAGTPSAASANGGAACPPEAAEANGDAAAAATGMTSAATSSPAGPAATARPSANSAGERTRTRLRWHAFVPGMFK